MNKINLKIQTIRSQFNTKPFLYEINIEIIVAFASTGLIFMGNQSNKMSRDLPVRDPYTYTYTLMYYRLH